MLEVHTEVKKYIGKQAAQNFFNMFVMFMRNNKAY